MAKTKCWSYNAGEPGKNWVRAYEDGPGGVLYLEWFEVLTDQAGFAVQELDRRAHALKPVRRRKRACLRTRDRATAVRKAEDAAAALATLEIVTTRPDVLTLDHLFTLYEREVTPEKGPKAQAHDRQAMRAHRAFFGGSSVVEAIRDGRIVTELGRKRYNDFVRLAGKDG